MLLLYYSARIVICGSGTKSLHMVFLWFVESWRSSGDADEIGPYLFRSRSGLDSLGLDRSFSRLFGVINLLHLSSHVIVHKDFVVDDELVVLQTAVGPWTLLLQHGFHVLETHG